MTSVWALPLAAALICLRPLKSIKICGIRNDRIGHFIGDGAEQFIRYYKRADGEIRLFYLVHPSSCNQQWETMLRRQIPVRSRWLRHIARWLRHLPTGDRHLLPSSQTESRDIDGLYRDGKAAISFLPHENAIALKWLESKGWIQGQPFVCLLVRDDAFLPSNPSANFGIPLHANGWDYHSYRNSNVEDYVPAIDWLIDQGVWVLRMGRTMGRRTPYTHERFIEYAFDADQSDLLDIWLFAHANAVVTTGSGLDVLAPIYECPMLMVNILPVSQIWSWCHCVSYPKKLKKNMTGERLSLEEHIQARYFTSEDYQSKGIDWVDLSAAEIRESVVRFWCHVQGKYNYVLDSQKAFWTAMAGFGHEMDHGDLHPQAIIEPVWMTTVHTLNTTLPEQT